MRRLAFLLAFGLSVCASADTASYLRLRNANNIVQPVGPAALREVVKPRVFELQGKVTGTCQSGDATILIFQRADGETQEIEAKKMPDWLGETNADVRLIVRCVRSEKGAALRAVLLDAARELEILPLEEAYWRRLAQTRRAATPKPASRHATTPRSAISGPIGRTSAGRAWALPRDRVTPYYAAFIQRRNPRLPAARALQIAEALVGYSVRYKIDPRLVVAMLIVESDFDPNAVSRSGAVGLGQLMPGTAAWMGVRNSYDTTDNLYGTVKLLRTHLNQYNDLSLTLAAYNAGMGAVRRHGGVPPYRETQAYVRRVTAIYRQLCGV